MTRESVTGTRLRHARTIADLTQTDVARALGVKQQQVAAWEGGTIPPARHHHRLAETLGVDLAVFVGWIADAYRDREDNTARELARTRHERDRLQDDLATTTARLDAVVAKLEKVVSGLGGSAG